MCVELLPLGYDFDFVNSESKLSLESSMNAHTYPAFLNPKLVPDLHKSSLPNNQTKWHFHIDIQLAYPTTHPPPHSLSVNDHSVSPFFLLQSLFIIKANTYPSGVIQTVRFPILPSSLLLSLHGQFLALSTPLVSRFSGAKTGVIWSNSLVLVISLAAAFWTTSGLL